MARLTRGERFKDARTVHNRHKKQTMDEVYAATGVSKSLIQSLEDDTISRSVGYDKVAKLAAHYHVTTDYLLGLSDDPAPMRSAVDDLGLSPKAVEWIESLEKKALCSDHDDHIAILNYLLESRYFHRLFFRLCEYCFATRAEDIYYAFLNSSLRDKSDHSAIADFHRKVSNIIDSNLFPQAVNDYLAATDELFCGLDYSTSMLAAVLEDETIFRISDLCESRAQRELTMLVGHMERYSKDDLQNILAKIEALPSNEEQHGNG